MKTVALSLVLAWCVHGQEFEAASLKPSQGAMPVGAAWSGGPGTPDPGQFTARWAALFELIGQAYGVDRFQIVGPEWLKTERFDVAAKIPAGATQEQFAVILRKLLEARFRLAVHREQREMPVYELVVAKNGPKVKESVGLATPPSAAHKAETGADGYPILEEGRVRARAVVRGWVSQRLVDVSMDRILAVLFRPVVDRPLFDRTGLTGKYDILLHYVMGSAAERGEGPALLEAAQAQLGLKLESKKGMVEVLVVDRVEKVPVEN